MTRIDPTPLVLNEENFDRSVSQSEAPVLVDFTAAWCAPCRAVAPIVDALAVEYADRLTVASVDVDEAPNLAKRFRVLSVPTVMLFSRGEVQDVLLGARPAADYRESIDSLIASSA